MRSQLILAAVALALAGCPHDFTRRPLPDAVGDRAQPDRPGPSDRGPDLAADALADARGADLALADGPRDLAAESSAPDGLVDAGPDLPTTDLGCPSPCVTTFAGTPGLSGFVDGPADLARFKTPLGLEVSPGGEVFVADAMNDAVRRIAGGMVSTFAGSGYAGFSDGPSLQAKFRSPESLVRSPGGTLFVADCFNHAIRSISGGSVTTLAGTGTYGFLDGPAASAKFAYPLGVALESGGALLVADEDNERIRRIAGGNASTLAGSGLAGYQDGPALQAKFMSPMDVAVDASGQVLVADAWNHRIRKIAGGQVTTIAGAGTTGYKDGAALQALFDRPAAIALGSAGEIFVADYGNNRIRRIAGGQVTTYAGSGVFGHKDGPGAVAAFRNPADVVVDGTGALYVADPGSHCVRRIK